MDDIYIDMRTQGHWITKYFPNKDFVSINDLIGCIEDLDSDIETYKEKYEDLERDLEENYRPIPVHEQYDVYESDFH